jgi:hypothetical protein|tara:strand:- start:420 stop:551 length:132 start_codon:yes stop_codon:yes gene_type:complete
MTNEEYNKALEDIAMARSNGDHQLENNLNWELWKKSEKSANKA